MRQPRMPSVAYCSGRLPASGSRLPVARPLAGEQLDGVLERRPQHGVAVAAAPGEPGRLTTSVLPATPATPRESSPCGVFAIESARSASAIPGATRSTHVERRLGRDVPRRRARCRRSSARARLGGELRDRRRDRVRARRARPAARPRSPSPASSSASRSPLRSSRVAARDAVGDGQHRGLHATGSFVFSTSRTSPTTMLLVDRLGHVVDRQRRDRRRRSSASISTPVCAVVSAVAVDLDPVPVDHRWPRRPRS